MEKIIYMCLFFFSILCFSDTLEVIDAPVSYVSATTGKQAIEDNPDFFIKHIFHLLKNTDIPIPSLQQGKKISTGEKYIRNLKFPDIQPKNLCSLSNKASLDMFCSVNYLQQGFYIYNRQLIL